MALPKTWSPLDFGLHAFLVVNPLALGLWIFSLAPLVGGNLFLAVVFAGVIILAAAVVFGSLAARWPWTGGDYSWQTRLLGPRIGVVLALTSWWLVAAALAPVYGNVLVVQVLEPLLTHAGWDGLASWFHGREGIFSASLIAIAVATAFVGMGMRGAAIAQRVVVVVGSAALVVVLALLITGDPATVGKEFDVKAADVYGASPLASAQIVEVGDLNAQVTEVDAVDTFRLVPLVLLFGLWIGWASPLAGEIRARKPESIRAALIRAAAASTVTSLLLLVAVGRGSTWEFWNEANNLYFGTLYGTTAATPLPAWPSPVVLAAWLTDSTFLQIAIIAGMAAWVIGWTATLFLGATRVLLAAASDRVLPEAVARTTGDSVPLVALVLLVVPACALAAVDAYWDAFAEWSAVTVVVLAVTTAGSGLAAVAGFGRRRRGLAAISALFVLLVVGVIGIWMLDPVYGLRTFGALAFLVALYGISTGVFVMSCRRERRLRVTIPDVSA
ncbi:MAG: APC family permease [Chloroflexi bacterium]|nr:APC family permease [Chloroflexota bacterium]